MKVVDTFRLYRIRKGDPTYNLIQDMINYCNQHELNINRWQSNNIRCANISKITWGIHKGERTQCSRQANLIYSIVLSQPEGKTEKCTAYKALSIMFEQLKKETQNALSTSL